MRKPIDLAAIAASAPAHQAAPITLPELRTINNGQPLTVRQLGNAFAPIGIRAETRKINGKSEKCYAASDFVILSSGNSQNALPSQGSGEAGE